MVWSETCQDIYAPMEKKENNPHRTCDFSYHHCDTSAF